MHARSRYTRLALAGLAACASLLAFQQPALAGETLTVNVHNARGQPGRVVALVLRTYASRGVGQGQICMAIRAQLQAPEGGGGPIAAVRAAAVFSAANDAVHQVDLVDGAGQSVMLDFSSASGSINAIDGPLAVVYVQLRNDLVPDQDFDVNLDLPNSFLMDPDGVPIPIEPRAGRLRVRGPGEPFELSAAAEATMPGGIALLSMQTEQLRLLSRGQLGIHYDPAIAAGLPRVRIDRRYGTSQFSLAGSSPAQGLIIVNFTSPGADLNRVTGDVIQVLVPTRADIAVGTRSPVWLDPGLTHMVNRQGQVMPLDFEVDFLEFIN